MKGILIDVTKCKGCMACARACSERDEERPVPTTMGDAGLSAKQWSTLIELDDNRFAKKSCLHCLTPNCEAACLVGAITKTSDGPVIYDADKCIGCRYCMLACQYHVPRYEWQKTAPLMRKCDMCADRLDAGDSPRCVSACDNGVLTFGERDVLLKKARETIAASPDRYLSHVFGEKEWGGTSVLYISDVPLEVIGWPEACDEDPVSALTDPIIHATPAVGLGVLLGTFGLGFIIERRNRLMERNASTPEQVEVEKEEKDDAE